MQSLERCPFALFHNPSDVKLSIINCINKSNTNSHNGIEMIELFEVSELGIISYILFDKQSTMMYIINVECLPASKRIRSEIEQLYLLRIINTPIVKFLRGHYKAKLCKKVCSLSSLELFARMDEHASDVYSILGIKDTPLAHESYIDADDSSYLTKGPKKDIDMPVERIMETTIEHMNIQMKSNDDYNTFRFHLRYNVPHLDMHVYTLSDVKFNFNITIILFYNTQMLTDQNPNCAKDIFSNLSKVGEMFTSWLRLTSMCDHSYINYGYAFLDYDAFIGKTTPDLVLTIPPAVDYLLKKLKDKQREIEAGLNALPHYLKNDCS